MDGAEPPTGRHALGPHVVGQRVVVRRLVPGETGPSGGPAMTDVLGVCESWYAGLATVRREDGTLVEIRTAEIVSGKPVPPRPSPRMRVSADEVHLRAMEGLRSRHVEHVGGWVLRATGGTTGRTNSVLPAGDPGMPFDDAVARVISFYAEHAQPALAQVVVDSDAHHAFEQRGWLRARPDQSDVDVMLVSLARARRAIRAALPRDPAEVRIAHTLTRDWLVGNLRALAAYEVVKGQLEGGAPEGRGTVAFASIAGPAGQLARGRASCSRDWLAITDLRTDPEHRRQHLAVSILAALLGWGAERGATTVQLQVLTDNAPAQALYSSLGWRRHHSYRYLVAP